MQIGIIDIRTSKPVGKFYKSLWEFKSNRDAPGSKISADTEMLPRMTVCGFCLAFGLRKERQGRLQDGGRKQVRDWVTE